MSNLPNRRDRRTTESANPPYFGGLCSRRDLLRVGSVAASSMLWPAGVPARRAFGAEAESRTPAEDATATSVILLFMMGGVTHLDSLDPKPEAPEEIRGTLSAIDTVLPGVQFSEAMPSMARVADRITLLRTMSHDAADHFTAQAYAFSGHRVGRNAITSEPNVGSVVSAVQGPRNSLPGYIAVPGTTRIGNPPQNMFAPAWLGGVHAPFAAGGQPKGAYQATEKLFDPPAEFTEDLRPQALELPLGFDDRRLDRRVRLRDALDKGFRRVETAASVDAYDGQYRDALHLLSSPQVRHAFDFSEEADAVRDRYGRTKIGGRCLVARRLVEAGARFVMVDYGYDPLYANLWDNHNAASQDFPHISEMAKRGYHVAGIDRAFAGLIADLEERGRLDSTLVVFLTEFGRTPTINPRGGRDHWPSAGSIFFAGGGAQRGHVIGTTDRHGALPTDVCYSPADVAATIFTAIGIPLHHRLYDAQNRPHFVMPHGHPIPGVLG